MGLNIAPRNVALGTAASGEIAQQLLARALRAEKAARLQVRGRCMEPLIRDGDWVEVLPPGAAQHGSIVLARNSSVVLAASGSDDLVCHRVIARDGDSVWLAGDHSVAVEEHLPESVLGRVISVDRGGVVQHLDGPAVRGLDRLEAGLHRLAWQHRGSLVSRVLEKFRRALLELRAQAWAAGAKLANRAGTSSRFRPASSR